MTPVPLSLLDLATVESNGGIGDALAHTERPPVFLSERRAPVLAIAAGPDRAGLHRITEPAQAVDRRVQLSRLVRDPAKQHRALAVGTRRDAPRKSGGETGFALTRCERDQRASVKLRRPSGKLGLGVYVHCWLGLDQRAQCGKSKQ